MMDISAVDTRELKSELCIYGRAVYCGLKPGYEARWIRLWNVLFLQLILNFIPLGTIPHLLQ